MHYLQKQKGIGLLPSLIHDRIQPVVKSAMSHAFSTLAALPVTLTGSLKFHFILMSWFLPNFQLYESSARTLFLAQQAKLKICCSMKRHIVVKKFSAASEVQPSVVKACLMVFEISSLTMSTVWWYMGTMFLCKYNFRILRITLAPALLINIDPLSLNRI